MELRGSCGGPFLPSVPGGVTERGLCASGEHDGATWVPLHRVVGTVGPTKNGLLTSAEGVLDRDAWRRMGKAPEVPEPLYSCPLAVEGVSAHCPSPQPAPAMQAAVESLGYARVGLPWGPSRSETTEPVRAMALAIDAAQNEAQAFKASGKGEDGW